MNLGTLPGSALSKGNILQRKCHEYVLVHCIKAGSDNRASGTAGVWQTSNINTLVEDETGLVRVSADRLRLPAGKYRVTGLGSTIYTGATTFRLRDVVNNITLAVSMSPHSMNDRAVQIMAHMADVFTIYRDTLCEFQSIVQVANGATNAMGIASPVNPPASMYETLELIRVLS